MMAQEQPVVSISIIGLEAVELVIKELPEIPIKSIKPMMRRISEIGVKVARQTLTEGASAMGTGKTAENMRGVIDESGPEDWSLRIGPDMSGVPRHTPKTAASERQHKEYPFWVSMGGTRGTGRVQIPAVRWGYSRDPRNWITVNLPRRITPHPWMQDVQKVISKEAGELFGENLYRLVAKLKREADKVSIRGFIL